MILSIVLKGARAQGGLANPVEVTFSSEGEVFGTVAVYQNVNGRTDALLHWLHGSVYNLRRDPVHPRTSRNLLPPMSRRGWVAPSGLTRYREPADRTTPRRRVAT